MVGILVKQTPGMLYIHEYRKDKAMIEKKRRVMRHTLLWMLVIMLLVNAGCSPIQVDVGFKQPAELTATDGELAAV